MNSITTERTKRKERKKEEATLGLFKDLSYNDSLDLLIKFRNIIRRIKKEFIYKCKYNSNYDDGAKIFNAFHNKDYISKKYVCNFINEYLSEIKKLENDSWIKKINYVDAKAIGCLSKYYSKESNICEFMVQGMYITLFKNLLIQYEVDEFRNILKQIEDNNYNFI